MTKLAMHAPPLHTRLGRQQWLPVVEQGGRKTGSNEMTAKSVQGKQVKNCCHVVNEHDKLKVIQVAQYLPTLEGP
jgi:hypothetical protein